MANLVPTKSSFFCFLLLILLIYGCKKESETSAPTLTDGRTGMLEAVNQLRKTGCKCGLDSMPPVPKLLWNDALASAANAHATDMYYNNYFSHISPGGSIPIQRAKDAGYAGNSVLENIAQGYNSLNEVMDAWKKSPDHCKSMMDSTYKEIGAARANQFWVQEFGKN